MSTKENKNISRFELLNKYPGISKQLNDYENNDVVEIKMKIEQER